MTAPVPKATGVVVHGRHVRHSRSLPIFASFASLAFVLVSVVDPTGAIAATAATTTIAPASEDSGPAQQLSVAGGFTNSIARDEFTTSVIAPPKPATLAAPAAGTPDPGSAQAIARDMLIARGWGDDEYSCLVALWSKESGWNVYAHNGSSGAYGIPQALPGEKMASAGADWATNPATQITWGLGYISGRYGTPCGAWSTSQAQGWY